MASRHTVRMRWVLTAIVASVLACQSQGPMDCPGFRSCVSSQAEADRLNGNSGCDNYVYCPPGDAGDDSPDVGHLGDGSLASDVAVE